MKSDIDKLSDADYELQHCLDEGLLNNYANKLTKRLKFYLGQNETKWKDWPEKHPKDDIDVDHQRSTQTSCKSRRNKVKKIRYQQRKIERIASEALAKGTVINLTTFDVPASSIAVLSYGEGFIPTPAKLDRMSFR